MAKIATLNDDQKRSMWLMAPPFVYALALLALPLLAVVLFSFWTQDFMSVPNRFTDYCCNAL